MSNEISGVAGPKFTKFLYETWNKMNTWAFNTNNNFKLMFKMSKKMKYTFCPHLKSCSSAKLKRPFRHRNIAICVDGTKEKIICRPNIVWIRASNAANTAYWEPRTGGRTDGRTVPQPRRRRLVARTCLREKRVTSSARPQKSFLISRQWA